MPCPERNMSAVINSTGEGGEHVPVDMELTCTAPQDGTIKEQIEAPPGAEEQTMAVYLRVRPFSKEELCDNEDQNCVVIENSQTVALNAPKGSATLKSSEKGVGVALHKFSFSKIFSPEVTQSELFEQTVKSQLHDFLDGKNALIFTYGVTNAGKTYTIQGTLKEPGILPRVLDATFYHMQGRQYEGMDLKPHLRSAVRHLDPEQVKQERSAKAAILASLREECESPRAGAGFEAWANSPVAPPSSSTTCSQNDLTGDSTEASSCQFTLWVAFFEIYNELVYDLLQPSLCPKSKKRASLRVCDDGAGNAYVKDLKWVNVQSLAEACRILQHGNKNRSAAATKMNQSSSRSHSIFTIKLLKVDGSVVSWISEFSLCDLAGSERCNKAKTIGERLKEAGNINNSLLILGKCITGLRNNQADRTKSGYIPFRESKLTKLFQAVFCGRGRASMIVNINQCASTYDETLHVMKFSAIAKQVVIRAKPLESLSPCLVRCGGKPLLRNGMIDEQALLESFLSEDDDDDDEEEELLDQDDEADVSLMPQNELLSLIENLRAKLVAERRRNVVQEMEIRKEMGDAMIQQILESEEHRSRQIEELKESYQLKMENTFEMYKDAVKEHAYQSAMNNLLDDYVPLDEFVAEQEKVEALTRKVSELENATSGTGGGRLASSAEQSCQTEPSSVADTAADDRCKHLYKEKCAMERLCEDKQQLILSLEERLKSLNNTLQILQDDLLTKLAEAETLQRTVSEQDQEMASLKTEITSLKAELAKLSLLASTQPRNKRGLLANIKEAVSSPKCTVKRSLRTTARTSHY